MQGNEARAGPEPTADPPAHKPVHAFPAASDRLSAAPAITVPLGTPLSVATRSLILSTLQHCGGERKRTAEILGICTKTLYNRLREYGMREESPRTMGEQHSMGDQPRVS